MPTPRKLLPPATAVLHVPIPKFQVLLTNALLLSSDIPSVMKRCFRNYSFPAISPSLKDLFGFG